MKRILVPCDFSYTAKQAYAFALEIAEKNDAELFVLNVIDLPFSYESAYAAGHYYHDEELLRRLQAESLKNFEGMAKVNRSYDRQHFSSVQGPVTQTIQTFIENEEIDLVVMGTNGASGMKEFFIGSNAEKTVRYSRVPVITVRELCGVKAIKNIVFPTDLNVVSPQLISHIKGLQALFNARLHVVFVSTEYHLYKSNEIMKRLEEFAGSNTLRNYTLNIQSGDGVEESIVSFSREIGADMIAMATHGRQGLIHLLTGSLAEDVVNHVHCPVWTFSTRGSKATKGFTDPTVMQLEHN